MTADQFVADFQSYPEMTREAEITLVETADGYILVRAQGTADVAYAASRASAEAIGDAVRASMFGDFIGLAMETPGAALELARINTIADRS